MKTSAYEVSRVLFRLLVIASPLLLNDFYLPLVPKESTELNLVLDVLVYIFWQSTVIYLAYAAGWFSARDLGVSFARIGRQVITGVILLAAVFILFIILMACLSIIEQMFSVKIPSIWYFPLPDWHPFPVFLYVTYLSVTAGIYEEIVYRGIAISQIRRITSSRLVLVSGSAFLFALIHWSLGPVEWITAFIFGILWGYLFIMNGMLIPIMIAHFLFDFITIYDFHQPLLKILGI